MNSRKVAQSIIITPIVLALSRQVIEDLNKIAEENKEPHPQQEVGVDY